MTCLAFSHQIAQSVKVCLYVGKYTNGFLYVMKSANFDYCVTYF